jgi:chromosome partitioning protein
VITLAISSLKGGVGKTTTAINLAFSLAKRGWRTLLLDADPQGSVGFSLSPASPNPSGLYDILKNGAALEDVALRTKLDTLRIVMAGKIPAGDVSRWCASLHDGALLDQFLAGLGEKFDLVVIDTPSGLHGPTEGVLRNATHVLVPQQCEPLALRSLMMTVEFLGQLPPGPHGACSLAGVLLTMADPKSAESREIVEEIRRLLPPELVCHALMPRDPAILTASMKGMPVGLMGGDAPPHAALLFDQLAAELEERLGLAHGKSRDEYVSLVV